jgi:hypothetical protein
MARHNLIQGVRNRPLIPIQPHDQSPASARQSDQITVRQNHQFYHAGVAACSVTCETCPSAQVNRIRRKCGEIIAVPGYHRGDGRYPFVDFRLLGAQIRVAVGCSSRRTIACRGLFNRCHRSRQYRFPVLNAVSRWISNWLNLIPRIPRKKSTPLNAENAVCQEPI